MKKRLLVIIFLIVLASVITLIAYNYLKEKEAATGKVVTGEATTGEIVSATNVSVNVVVNLPGLRIKLPKNQTYITTQNLSLNFTSSDASSIWYNLDNGTNTTVSSNTTFSTTSGLHTLYLFANNTDGNQNSTNVTFSINTTRLKIFYGNYTGVGRSTDFNKSSYEDLQNLSNIILEQLEHGRIGFNTAINITNDNNFSDGLVNIDSSINISSNRIEVNTAALPNFDVTATLYLYNLTFTNPRVLRDGAVCSASICTENSYTGGTFSFNVTGFTIYSAGETPGDEEESSSSSGGGGGGGGAAIATFQGLRVSTEQISISLKQGEVATRTLTITNNAGRNLNIKIEPSKINKFLIISEEKFSLNSGESKKITLDFIAREDEIPEIYLGKIIINSEEPDKEIFVSIEVESKDTLLDVNVEIPPGSKRVLPGRELLAQIKMFNLGFLRSLADVRVDYYIMDEEENIILEEHETVAIETQTSFLKRISIPEDMNQGNYVLYIKATYDGEIASASARFEVVEELITGRDKMYLIMIFSLIIVSFIIFYTLHKKEENRDTIRRRADIRDISET